MSNIKAGGKVFRDVEKMNLDELTQVRQALVVEQQRIVAQGQRLPANAAGRSQFVLLDGQLKQLDVRFRKVDTLAKALIKKDTVAKLT